MSSRLAERTLETIDWSTVQAANGDGSGVKRALMDLMLADGPEASTHAYWRIENNAFAQGELFEVSTPCMSVLVACLADSREAFVRIAVLELMFQILGGYASTARSTPSDVLQRCQDRARGGLLLLFREAICGERDAAMDVLERLGEGARVRELLSA